MAMPKEAKLPQGDACGAKSGTDEQPHRDAHGKRRTVSLMLTAVYSIMGWLYLIFEIVLPTDFDGLSISFTASFIADRMSSSTLSFL